ncbi:Hypothetical predicted protein [Paramuricea clavata]|uniref:Cytoskeleton-associated protein 2 C-terminal domain-containing protein n=1 Tax=Paramuricea clavata TaxID=317549 RepID=A0A6S7IET5_PARCT|nr:Hypothetical predicted protein [Paramuricea clavata]
MGELQVLQNKAAKIILDRPLYSSATDALSALKWLDLRRRRNFHRCIHIWNKTPQTPTLSKRGLLKTPVGTTPNQRRKTWCFTEPNNKSTAVRTPCRRRSGILKHGNLTEKQTKRSCSFILRNKDDLTKQIAGLTSSDSFTSHTSNGIMLAVEEEKVLRSLEKCYEMFEENVCTQEEIVFSLDDIQREHPNVLRHALYWICRAKLAENVGDHERVVCMVDQASGFSAQPKELVQKYFDEYKSRKQIEDKKVVESPVQEATFRTPYKTPSRELSKLDGEVFNSSVVRFCLIDSTPARNRRKSASEKRVLTPVRRTTRWERCGITHPKTIEENRITVASLNELSSPIRSTIVYKPNSLLPCQLDEEMRNLANIDES